MEFQTKRVAVPEAFADDRPPAPPLSGGLRGQGTNTPKSLPLRLSMRNTVVGREGGTEDGWSSGERGWPYEKPLEMAALPPSLSGRWRGQGMNILQSPPLRSSSRKAVRASVELQRGEAVRGIFAYYLFFAPPPPFWNIEGSGDEYPPIPAPEFDVEEDSGRKGDKVEFQREGWLYNKSSEPPPPPPPSPEY